MSDRSGPGPDVKDTRKRLPLSIVLLAVILPLMAAVVGIVIWQNYEKSTETALNAGRQLFTNLKTEVALQQTSLLGPVKSALDVLAASPELTPDGLDAFEKPFMALLDAYPHMAAIRAGFETGDVLEVVTVRAMYGGTIATIAADDRVKFAARRTRPGNGSPQWRFFDRRLEALSGTTETPIGSDPLHMPWYVAGMNAPGLELETLPYILSDTGTEGISATRGIVTANGVTGALAADIALRQYSLPLENILTEPEQQVFLFTGNGLLLANTDYGAVVPDMSTAPIPGDPVKLRQVDSLSQPAAQAIVREFKAMGSSFSLRTLAIGESQIMASVTRLAVGDGPDGSGVYLAFALPVSTFTGVFIGIGRDAALFSLAVLVLSIPIIVVIAGRLTAPLANLARATDRIAKLDLSARVSEPTSIAEIATLGRSLDRMTSALTQIAKFVPKSLVQDLIQSGADLGVGGERRAIGVLFTDVKDFTPLSESLPPEELMAQMSAYFDAVVRVVLEHCGTVDKFVGDAVFAFWNAPTLQSDFEIATCRAALAVKAATNALNETWRQEGKPAWYTRIGVHTGDAVVGNVGSSDRLDYTAIGDTVNMGSRIEGLNKFYGTQILVSDAMAARVQEVFLLRPVDTVVPKGGSAPFKIWELVGERDQISGEDSARCEAWHGVAAACQRRDWRSAAAELTRYRAMAPNDGVAAVYAARLAKFERDPPPPEWDGVERFSDK